MSRVALFAAVGLASFMFWLWSVSTLDVQHQYSSDWLIVTSFSAVLIGLVFALPAFAQFVGGQLISRLSLIPAAGTALAAVSNVVEDGLQQSWAFWPFVLGAAITAIGLLVLSLAIVSTRRGGRRLLAAVPAATLIGQLIFPTIGGVLLPGAWFAAAALVVSSLRTREPVAMGSPGGAQ